MATFSTLTRLFMGPRKCSQLLGMHAPSGCDTVSYPIGKGKLSALKILDYDIQGLYTVLGEPNVTMVDLKKYCR